MTAMSKIEYNLRLPAVVGFADIKLVICYCFNLGINHMPLRFELFTPGNALQARVGHIIDKKVFEQDVFGLQNVIQF